MSSRYIINTTYGEWSAGTEVDIVNAGDNEVVGVHPVNSDVATHFDIPMNLLTKRRNRTDEIAVPTREEKRADRAESVRINEARESDGGI